MKRVNRFFYIPFIICIILILFIYYLLCLFGISELENPLFSVVILSLSTILIELSTNPAYIIRKRLIKKKNK